LKLRGWKARESTGPLEACAREANAMAEPRIDREKKM
jgi:hypothetical protein